MVLPTYGLTQVASTLTLVPTAWAVRKFTPPRPRVLWVGVAVNVLALLGATWLFVDFASTTSGVELRASSIPSSI